MNSWFMKKVLKYQEDGIIMNRKNCLMILRDETTDTTN